jgi:DMSO reductase anchor subunit
MLAWISDTIYRIISWIPNWLYVDDTPRYFIVRGMLGVALIVAIIFAIAVWRDRALRMQQSGQNAGETPPDQS